MSFPYYPGHPMLTGSITSCPPPSDCCCDNFWEIAPGTLVPKTIDVTNWIKTNLGNRKVNLDDVLVKLSVVDLNVPAVTYPTITPPVVTLPLVAGPYFTIKKVRPFTEVNRMGYAVDVETSATAIIDSRLRLDYTFTVHQDCGDDYIGNGCVMIIVRKCFTGMA